MAQNSLYCADVQLSNYSLTHSMMPHCSHSFFSVLFDILPTLRGCCYARSRRVLMDHNVAHSTTLFVTQRLRARMHKGIAFATFERRQLIVVVVVQIARKCRPQALLIASMIAFISPHSCRRRAIDVGLTSCCPYRT